MPALRETDTFDTFMESCGICALHLPGVQEGMLDSKAANYWLPVDITLVVSNTPLCTCSTSASSTN
ncbi:hypothetical protein ACNKHM_03700 [Shigella sonnei]